MFGTQTKQTEVPPPSKLHNLGVFRLSADEQAILRTVLYIRDEGDEESQGFWVSDEPVIQSKESSSLDGSWQEVENRLMGLGFSESLVRQAVSAQKTSEQLTHDAQLNMCVDWLLVNSSFEEVPQLLRDDQKTQKQKEYEVVLNARRAEEMLKKQAQAHHLSREIAQVQQLGFPLKEVLDHFKLWEQRLIQKPGLQTLQDLKIEFLSEIFHLRTPQLPLLSEEEWKEEVTDEILSLEAILGSECVEYRLSSQVRLFEFPRVAKP